MSVSDTTLTQHTHTGDSILIDVEILTKSTPLALFEVRPRPSVMTVKGSQVYGIDCLLDVTWGRKV